MILATDEKTVSGFVEFELIKLAERINVGGNLTPAQIEFTASQLVGMYPNETIADFKICFERGASGRYGKIWKLDGVEIGTWMSGTRDADGKIKQLGYLDEKYQVMEDQLMKEKDGHYKQPLQNTDWLELWKAAIKESDKEGGVKTESKNISYLNNLRAITPQEIRKEGQETPARPDLYKDPHSPEWYELKDRIRRAASKFYADRYSFKKMQMYTVGDHEVFAESAEDAERIYKAAIK